MDIKLLNIFNFEGQNAPSDLYIEYAKPSTTGSATTLLFDNAPEDTTPGIFWFNNCSTSTWGNSNCGCSEEMETI